MQPPHQQYNTLCNKHSAFGPSKAACDMLRGIAPQTPQGQARPDSTVHQALPSRHSIKREKILILLPYHSFVLFMLSSFSFQQHLAFDPVLSKLLIVIPRLYCKQTQRNYYQKPKPENSES